MIKPIFSALIVAAALAAFGAAPARALTHGECVASFKAKAESRRLVCDRKQANARQDCFDAVSSDLQASIGACPHS